LQAVFIHYFCLLLRLSSGLACRHFVREALATNELCRAGEVVVVTGHIFEGYRLQTALSRPVLYGAESRPYGVCLEKDRLNGALEQKWRGLLAGVQYLIGRATNMLYFIM
jgi:hypothetical protein